LFITYRLKFTLPSKIMEEFARRRQEWLKEWENALPEDKQAAKVREAGLRFAWFDELLDKSFEVPGFLQSQEITDIIATAFQHFNGLRYRLIAYCVMPNHVHALILPLQDAEGNSFSPARIIYGWKRYTANRINRSLGRTGSLWQKESYDHVVRDEKEMINVTEYIIQNPVRAGLVKNWEEWPGTWIAEDLRPECVL